MKISWKLTKRRGGWPAILEYTTEREDLDNELAVKGGDSYVTLAGWQSLNNCSFGTVVSGHTDEEKDVCLRFPSWNHGKPDCGPCTTRMAIVPSLPPEIPRIMAQFMAEWEGRVLEALASQAIEQAGEVEYSPEFKKKVAPIVAAKKMLNGRGGG